MVHTTYQITKRS